MESEYGGKEQREKPRKFLPRRISHVSDRSQSRS